MRRAHPRPPPDGQEPSATWAQRRPGPPSGTSPSLPQGRLFPRTGAGLGSARTVWRNSLVGEPLHGHLLDLPGAPRRKRPGIRGRNPHRNCPRSPATMGARRGCTRKQVGGTASSEGRAVHLPQAPLSVEMPRRPRKDRTAPPACRPSAACSSARPRHNAHGRDHVLHIPRPVWRGSGGQTAPRWRQRPPGRPPGRPRGRPPEPAAESSTAVDNKDDYTDNLRDDASHSPSC